MDEKTMDRTERAREWILRQWGTPRDVAAYHACDLFDLQPRDLGLDSTSVNAGKPWLVMI
jgi:hypothetical protein